jgi:hypothetical protein
MSFFLRENIYPTYKDKEVEHDPVHEMVTVFCNSFEIKNKCTVKKFKVFNAKRRWQME